jgi:heme/copper-type cytochrome/quinol oxidase subunit 4
MPSAENNSPGRDNSRAMKQFKHAFIYSLAGLVVSVGLLIFMLVTRPNGKGINGVSDVVILVIVCAVLTVGCGLVLRRSRR